MTATAGKIAPVPCSCPQQDLQDARRCELCSQSSAQECHLVIQPVLIAVICTHFCIDIHAASPGSLTSHVTSGHARVAVTRSAPATLASPCPGGGHVKVCVYVCTWGWSSGSCVSDLPSFLAYTHQEDMSPLLLCSYTMAVTATQCLQLPPHFCLSSWCSACDHVDEVECSLQAPRLTPITTRSHPPPHVDAPHPRR